MSNAKGISNEDVSELQKELQQMAAELVGEVRCILCVTLKSKVILILN